MEQPHKFRIDNYITVPGFAIVELGLSGNELLCYSLIYGFTQDKETKFKGSLTYISSALNVTKQNAKKIIDRLIDRGLIDKHELFVSGVKFCHYTANREGVAETATGGYRKNNEGIAETATGSITETAPNNTIIDNSVDITKNNPAVGGLFSDDPEFQTITVVSPAKQRGTSEKLCTFEQSKFYDYKLFSAEFEKPEFKDVDIFWYYSSIADWSASAGKKKHDWIATARNWMRRDMEQGKLRKLQGSCELSEEAKEYLRDMADGL